MYYVKKACKLVKYDLILEKTAYLIQFGDEFAFYLLLSNKVND